MPNFVNDSVQTLVASKLQPMQFVKREIFNPTNTQHIDSLRKFITTGNWGDIQFFAEHPYTDVPSCVMRKFAQYQLSQ
jgi:hypothetical protein